MSDLISRQKVIKRIEELPNSPNGYSATYDKASIILAIEDVEPVELVHAHWIVEPYRGDLLRYACSNPKCKYYEFHVYKEYRGSNYCPDCGAKMDGEIRNDG